ncbi:MAG: sigma-70 family RNA polymerase sigma factor [Opitutaceae bacterium]|nr:sigma-70 family RNA polymerase sigma factor [Opitutaceae bacterium]
MDQPSPQDPAARDEAYLRLLAEHERALSTYVFSLVNSRADAADILQECKLALWRMFDRFEPGTNFLAWARTVALHQILNYRRAAQRRPESPHEREFIEAVAAEIDRRSDDLDRRSEVLRHCLQKLPERHRSIVVWRYYEECEVETIAAKSDRSVLAVYRLLSRIRETLNDCISRQLAATRTP